MWPHNPDDRSEPPVPEWDALLAAYLDGELGDEDRSRVEDWLSHNPVGRAALDAQVRLKDWFESAPAPEPDAQTWDDALGRLEAALFPVASVPDRPQRLRRRPLGRGPWLWAVGVAAAASLLFALRTSRDGRPGPRPDEPAADALAVVAESDVTIDDMDPADADRVIVGRMPVSVNADLDPGKVLEMTDAADVNIVSMDAADTAVLVVGAAPVDGPLLLASQGDVRVDHLEPHPDDDIKPYLHAPRNGWPMLVAPLKSSQLGKD